MSTSSSLVQTRSYLKVEVLDEAANLPAPHSITGEVTADL